MEKIRVYKFEKHRYYGEITDFIDRYVTENYRKEMYRLLSRTYLLGIEDYRDHRGTCIRFPGATRGFIELDRNDIITEIRFYEDTCFGTKNLPKLYDRKIENDIKHFIGKKLILEE